MKGLAALSSSVWTPGEHHFSVAIETPDGWSDWSPVVQCVPPLPQARVDWRQTCLDLRLGQTLQHHPHGTQKPFLWLVSSSL